MSRGEMWVLGPGRRGMTEEKISHQVESWPMKEQGRNLFCGCCSHRLLSGHHCWGHMERQKKVSFGQNSDAGGLLIPNRRRRKWFCFLPCGVRKPTRLPKAEKAQDSSAEGPGSLEEAVPSFFSNQTYTFHSLHLWPLPLHTFQIYLLPPRKGAKGTFLTLATGKQHGRMGRGNNFHLIPSKGFLLCWVHTLGTAVLSLLPPTTISATTPLPPPLVICQ